jgi:hypothetical protein
MIAGGVHRNDLYAPAIDANIMPIEMIDAKMQLDKFIKRPMFFLI